MYLIAQYLDDFGLKQTKSLLCTEANLSSDCKICDNIDLDTIYLDYCSYYHLKFGKQPKIIKRNDSIDINVISSVPNNKTKSIKAKNNEKQQDIKKNPIEPIVGELNVVPCIRNIENGKDVCTFRKKINLFENFTGEMCDLAHIIERC